MQYVKKLMNEKNDWDYEVAYGPCHLHQSSSAAIRKIPPKSCGN